MTKLRVYEYAKQLNMSSKEIITILSRLNIPVNNHMSVMEPEMVAAVEGFFSDVKARAATRTAEQQRQQAREAERRRMAEQRRTEAAERQEAGVMAERMEAGRVAGSAATGIQTRTAGGGDYAAQRTAPSQDAGRAAVSAALTETAGDVAVRPVEPREHKLDDNAAQVTGARSTQGAGSSRAALGAQQSSAPRHIGSAPRRDSAPGARRHDDRPERGSGRDAAGADRSGGDRGQRTGGYSGEQRHGGMGSGGGPRSGPDRAGGQSRQSGNGGGYGGPRAGASAAPRTAGGDTGGYGGRPRTGGGYGSPRSGGPRSGGGYGGAVRNDSSSGSGGSARYGSGAPGGAQRSGFGGNRSSTSDARGAGARGAGAVAGDRRPATGGGRTGGGRPGDRRGGGGRDFGHTASPPPFGAAAATNGQGGRKRTPGRDGANGRGGFGERRENNRRLSPPRGRGRGRAENVVRAPEGPRQVTVDSPMIVGEFAHLIRREASEVIKKLLFLGVLVTINQEIDTDTMVLVGGEFGTTVQVDAPRDLEAEEMLHEEIDKAQLIHRPPVVTIMGHVDHGKTTLLDAIRETNVTATEAGGITQHIGAYQVEVNQKKITFLDTPGHEAFTTMRARGAQVTDITVLVVAADDGVMPQTVEAINHAKAANVPIIVAVNKIDKPGAAPDRVKQELTEHGLVAEEWGGDTIFVPVSALAKQGIEGLLEMILLVAEVQDLKASPEARCRGTVIEAQLDKGRGPVATILVQNGTLHVGDIVMAGNTFGKVRAMVNDRGRRVKEMLPSSPVEVVGLSDVPSAGDPFVVYDDERQARNVAERRAVRQRAEELGATSRVTLDDLYKQIKEGEVKDLNLIVKADVHGSAEAVLGALQKIDVSGVRIKVIHSGVGAITESDILLASASNAIVVGFNVRPEANVAKIAESEKVDIRLYRVIYNLIEEIETALKGMLEPVYKEVVLGRAEVRQLFKVSKVGTIAGAMVRDGKIVRDGDARVIRDGVVVYEGRLDSLKRFKEDAREVASGYECGFTLERFNDLKEGDVVEVFKMEAVKVD